MTSAPAAVRRHARFTVEQFHRLCDAVPEQRLELIDGEVLQVIAKGTRHTAVVHRLIAAIQACLAASPPVPLQLRVEAPLDLGPADEPEPDLALVARRDDDYWDAHPTAADTALVIEVADSSLAFDLEAKARLYGAAGIPHYWVIDVQTPRLHVVREQSTGLDPAALAALRRAVETVLRQLPRP
ncbi:Uma2 family endonuclease [Aphanothece minutissima]|uniref:Uma2 family endonuclease n=1 Tax=Aphanothece cf. minutissima CCALA 015 TaxID=2107695 RepID=A0ABX5FBF2_9CHRO|nr:Uma2 family endonuclease [Aphanothece minutissima]PSB39249.1 Uma2 family endonuclease [Aphanothece cf. minutissima CCALA 015]